MNNRMTSAFKHCLLILIIGLLGACVKTTQIQEAEITPEEARAIAKEAYIYGFPLVDNYRIQYTYFVDRDNPEFKAPWNQIRNTPRVYTHEDKAVQAANSDTPYSHAGLDLRAEPVVLTVPVIENNRYYSIQLIDAYTHNFAYIGSRATGSEGGSFLIAGPRWRGDKPEGIKDVIRSETDFVLAWYRTQLFNPADLDNVKQVQGGYKVELLSEYKGTATNSAAPKIDFPAPLSREEQKSSAGFFDTLNFVLQYCPTHPSEEAIMERFSKLGIGLGGTYDSSKLSPELLKAVEDGIQDAWQQDFAEVMKRVNAGEVTSGDAFGTREHLKNNYLVRWAGAKVGIYANSQEEAMYPVYYQDANGQKLDGSSNYTLRFAPGKFPPVNAFWSVTMYEMPTELMVENPINRYLINAAMLPQLKRDVDGGVTLNIQYKSPGTARESNWLPAPNGPYRVQLRLYSPKDEAINGAWKRPEIEKAK